jgi:hypothetical protein
MQFLNMRSINLKLKYNRSIYAYYNGAVMKYYDLVITCNAFLLLDIKRLTLAAYDSNDSITQ